MDPDSKRDDLLYVSDQNAGDVYVYSWPAGKLEGTLTGFSSPQGLCVDKAGDVWIVAEFGTVVEYAHGGTTPIATLSGEPGYVLNGCSVDPTTGNLAVTSANAKGSSGPGHVSIYQNARGTPKIYSDSQLFFWYFLGYDNDGNLFVDGVNKTKTENKFGFAELPKGKHTFTNITLNRHILSPGGVQWVGKSIAVGDQGSYNGSPMIYTFRISGRRGVAVSTIPLTRKLGAEVPQFWIEGKRVVGPDFGSCDVGFYHYPAGGKPYKIIRMKINVNKPVGATVSRAS